MKKLWIIIIVSLLFTIPIAWYLLSPLFIVIEINEVNPLEQKVAINNIIKTMNNTMNSLPIIIAKGKFIANAHEVKGKASLIEIDGKKILRFEEFETINGPDLRIYLSSDLSNDNFVELSKIKATKGNVNYDVPENINLNKYNHVLVWCKPFGVLFSYAVLVK